MLYKFTINIDSFVCVDVLRPYKQFPAISERFPVFLGCTSTKAEDKVSC